MMTMPYLNDIDDYEWSLVDCAVIIFNLCIGFIFGWDTMIYVLTISVIGLGLVVPWAFYHSLKSGDDL